MNEINENEMNEFSMLCEDEILEVFYKFRYENSKLTKDEAKVLEKTLHYYKPYFLPTKEQKKCLEILEQKMPSLLDEMTQERCILPRDKALELTKFKVILSTSRSDFPFVNIKDKKNEKLQNNFTASFVSGESRDKALAHFKALFKNAKSIFIFDKFLFADNESDPIKPEKLDNFEKLIYGCEIYSNKNCDIYLPKNQQTQYKQYQKSKYKNIVKQDQNNKNYNINNTHDRYIIIDGKIEIILTSGFEYLFDTTKDFTYVLKEK